MKTFLWALTALVLLAMPISNATAEDTDRTDPVATARAFLKVYQARDAAGMAPLMIKDAQPFFADLAAKGEAHEGWNEVFGGWRMEQAIAWTRELSEARYKGGKALVRFTELADGEIGVIVMIKEGDVWGVDDINSPTAEEFQELPTAPE